MVYGPPPKWSVLSGSSVCTVHWKRGKTVNGGYWTGVSKLHHYYFASMGMCRATVIPCPLKPFELVLHALHFESSPQNKSDLFSSEGSGRTLCCVSLSYQWWRETRVYFNTANDWERFRGPLSHWIGRHFPWQSCSSSLKYKPFIYISSNDGLKC